MERNRMMMSLLGVNQAAARVERVVASAAVTVGTASSAAPRPRPPAKKPQKRERTEEPSQPVRRSSRVAGGPAPAEELGAEGELLHVDEEGAGEGEHTVWHMGTSPRGSAVMHLCKCYAPSCMAL